LSSCIQPAQQRAQAYTQSGGNAEPQPAQLVANVSPDGVERDIVEVLVIPSVFFADFTVHPESVFILTGENGKAFAAALTPSICAHMSCLSVVRNYLQAVAR